VRQNVLAELATGLHAAHQIAIKGAYSSISAIRGEQVAGSLEFIASDLLLRNLLAT